MNCDDVFDQIKNTATEVVEFPGGHMPHIENKEALRFTLKKFVKDCYTK
jgi:hypothetical protein